MSRKIYYTLFAILFVSYFCHSVNAAGNRWQDAVNEIDSIMHKVVDAYGQGDKEDAKGFVSDAYFTVFEGEGMETAVRLHVSSKRAYELETMFGDIRKAVNANAPVSDVKDRIDLLVKALRDVDFMLTFKGEYSIKHPVILVII